MENKTVFKILVGAFLNNDEDYLLLLRSPDKKILPNTWSYIGGHMEKKELNDPLKTCLREIKEETGIDRKEIYNIKLRYIIFNQHNNIIWQSYIYFGETNSRKLIKTNDGILHWIPKNELLNKKYSKEYMEMMKHFINTSDIKNSVYIGIVEKKEKDIKINWSILEDYE